MTEHLKEYLPYQPFLVKTDNYPLTYIMMTPNLDAMGHQRVSSLAQCNFELEYQKGCDNMVADALSWVPSQMDPDTVRSILDWVTLGTVHRTTVHDPTIIKGNWSRRCMLPWAVPLYKCMLLIGLKPRNRTWCWTQCWTGWCTEEDRFEGTSGRTCLWWRRPADLMELAEFHNSSRGLVPALNTQRWDQRSSTLCSP